MQPLSSSAAENGALARLDDAFKGLDAINPEASIQLVRNLLERLQMTPQIHAQVSPPKLQQPNAIATPGNEIVRRKRTQSMGDGRDRRGMRSRQSNHDLIHEDDESEFDDDREKTQGEMLADVLYSRWVAGLRSRWEERQMTAMQQKQRDR